MSKHTPGPWEVLNTGNEAGELPAHYWSVWAKSGRVICTFPRLVDGEQEQQAADVRLIAAAPELLEALQFVMRAHGEQLDAAFQQAQEAIAKATGEQA